MSHITNDYFVGSKPDPESLKLEDYLKNNPIIKDGTKITKSSPQNQTPANVDVEDLGVSKSSQNF